MTVVVLAFGGAALAEPLVSGDLPAVVTLGDRPVSASGRKVAFTRGRTLYVSAESFVQVANGTMTRGGNRYTITTFPGTSTQRIVIFTVGSADASVDGKHVQMTAPAISAYGGVYIPVSFFGSGALRTKVKISSDNRSAVVKLPKDMR